MQPQPVFCFLAKHLEQVVRESKEFATRWMVLPGIEIGCFSSPSPLLITRLAEPLRGTQ